jgi:hypothetical protein
MEVFGCNYNLRVSDTDRRRIIHGSDRAGLGIGPLLLTYNQDRWKKQKIKQIEYCFQKQKTELNCTKKKSNYAR